jgi:hypothetical protein
MRRFPGLLAFAVAAGLFAAASLASPAFAASAAVPSSTAQSSSWNPSPSAATFAPDAITTGALTSGNLDTGTARAVDCEVQNGPSAGARTVQAQCWDPTFTSTVGQYPTTLAVATGQTGFLLFDPAAPGTSQTNVYGSSMLVYPVRPCRYLTVGAAAAAGPARLLCTLRSH